VACEKYGFNQKKRKLTTEHFQPGKSGAEQLSLFA